MFFVQFLVLDGVTVHCTAVCTSDTHLLKHLLICYFSALGTCEDVAVLLERLAK